MISFSKQQLSKMLQLNEEFMTSSPERRKEIEQQIIAMVPKEYAADQQITELSKLQSDLKDKINALGECASKDDLIGFFKQVKELDQKIYEQVKKLGVELNRTDYGPIMAKMLEAKFGKQE